MKIIHQNKKAYHDYFIEDTYESGIVLTGTEIKSIRNGSVSLKDSYVRIRNNEAFIIGMNVSSYHHGNIFNHDPLRSRKLLLHKKQINKLERIVKEDGLTIIPTKIYLKNGMAKLEIAIARGKHLYDKRQVEKDRDAKREIERALKQR